MLPESFPPMLATIAEPFDSTDFTYEIKWDGYRCLAFIDSGTRLLSRNQNEITQVFPELQNLHQKLKTNGCILDGEIIALRNGKPSFLELQKRAQLRDLKEMNFYKTKIPVIYVAFDLLYLNQKAIYHKPIAERRESLLSNCYPENEFILANFIENKGIAYFKSINALGLEGVIAKKNGSTYLPGKRVKTWLKFKRKLLGNFVVCGYLRNTDPRPKMRSLILGAYLENKLHLFGMVGSGFSPQEIPIIQLELKKLTTEICPFTGTALKQKYTIWIRPLIVCEIEYLELTDEGSLRHPVFKKFRPDLQIEDCQYEG
jgi:DNA ligase D-like protein (predicted ligase)